MKRKTLLRLILLIVLALQLAAVAVSLYQSPERYLDSDDAAEMVLAREMAREGALISDNWYYSTEIRILGPQTVWALLFLFTDQWALIRVIGTMIMLVLLLWAYGYFARSMKLGIAGECLAPALLAPISIPYFKYAVSVPYYAFPLIMVFWMFGLYASLTTQKMTLRRKSLLYTLAILFSFLYGLVGVRSMMTLYAPMAVTVFAGLIIKERDWKAIALPKYRIPLMMTAAALVGFICCNGFLLNHYHVSGVASVQVRNASAQDITTILWGIPAFFGYTEGTPVFSLAAVASAFAIGLSAAYIACLVYVLKHLKKFTEAERAVLFFSVAALLVNGICFICLNMYTSRYYIPVLILYLPTFAILLRNRAQTEENRLARSALAGLLALALLTTAITGYRNYFATNQSGSIAKASKYLAENDYDYGYATIWNSNIVTELTNGKVDCVAVTGFEKLRKAGWLTYVQDKGETYAGKAFVLMTKDEYENQPQAFADFAAANGVLIYNESGYVAYGFTDIQKLKEFRK
ncbi:MAG: hypothetical protein PHY64_14175 [Eubacteriales bacterium]|nr:hypothetical protein [Eubacteriales bacterium]